MLTNMGLLSLFSNNKVNYNKEDLTITGKNNSVEKDDMKTQIMSEIKIGIEILIIIIVIVIVYIIIQKWRKRQREQLRIKRDMQLSILGLLKLPGS